MTDRRATERTSLLREFAARGLAEREIAPDGHCLFAAVADQLEQRGIPLSPSASASASASSAITGPPPATSSSAAGINGTDNNNNISNNDGGNGGGGASSSSSKSGSKPPPQTPTPTPTPTPPYRAVRRAATDYIEAHPDDFAPFLEEPLRAYAARVRDAAEWGGQLELAALAAAYRVPIRVVQDGRTETIEPPSSSSSSVATGEEEGDGKGGEDRRRGGEPIWLAYYRHGYGLGEHYNSLRKAAG